MRGGRGARKGRRSIHGLIASVHGAPALVRLFLPREQTARSLFFSLARKADARRGPTRPCRSAPDNWRNQNVVGGSEQASLARSLPPTLKGALTEERSPSPATLSPGISLHICYLTTTRKVLFSYYIPLRSINLTPSSLIIRKLHTTQQPAFVYPLRPTAPRQSGLPATHQRPPCHLYAHPISNTSLPSTTRALFCHHPTINSIAKNIP